MQKALTILAIAGFLSLPGAGEADEARSALIQGGQGLGDDDGLGASAADPAGHLAALPDDGLEPRLSGRGANGPDDRRENEGFAAPPQFLCQLYWIVGD